MRGGELAVTLTAAFRNESETERDSEGESEGESADVGVSVSVSETADVGELELELHRPRVARSPLHSPSALCRNLRVGRCLLTALMTMVI